MMEQRRYIEYIPIDQVVPADVNPKDHTLPDITASMKRWGYTEPILLDERTGKLIAGHGRCEALQEIKAAGGTPPPGVEVNDGGEWLVPITRGWASKDDIEAKAYLIASNRLTEKGGWHQDPLAAMLAEIQASGHGLTGIGYDSTEAQDMLDALAGPPDLDALAKELGEPQDHDFWPVLRFKVPPTIRARYLALVADVPGGDAEQFTWMVVQIETAIMAARKAARE
jgi:hypothetical protein